MLRTDSQDKAVTLLRAVKDKAVVHVDQTAAEGEFGGQELHVDERVARVQARAIKHLIEGLNVHG